MKKLTLKDLQLSYYLSGWKLFVYRYFMKYVYPAWEEGHKKHDRLIKEGHIAHLEKNIKWCTCGDDLITN